VTAKAVPRPVTNALPDGFEVRLRGDVIRADGGRVLIGGSPARAVRLSARAIAMFVEDRLVVDGAATAGLARRLLEGNLANPVVDAFEVRPSELTVVVPVRDRVEQLDRCLAALTPLRVLVVDDASEDPAAVARVARRHGATVVALARNVGPAGARNAGLARVGTALVAFVDSDIVVDGGALLDLARHCADPRVALVGPAVVGEPRGAHPRWFERYDAAASSLDLGRVAYQVQPGAAVGWLPSACLVGRVGLLGDGFDPGMRVAEDVDLVWRLVDAGLVVRYDPSVVALHEVRGTVRGWLGRKFVYGTGGADLGIRHGDKVAPAVLSVTMALSSAALMQRRRWSVPVAAVAMAVTTRSLRPSLPVAEGATAIAARLSLRGLGWAVRQESGLLLRHWWPAAAVGAVFSGAVRRALVTAVLVDLVVFLRGPSRVALATAVIARRLDDLAYGSGLWWGAIRSRNLRCLAVRRLTSRA
jgi:mycofactocin system glycosyltransferase